MRKLLLIAALALLAPAAAQAAKEPAKPAAEKAPAKKPATAKPAARPAAPARPAAASQGPFDARDPASLVSLLSGMDAKATVAERNEGDVKLAVTTPSFSFGAQYVGCSTAGKGCQALAFSTASQEKRATLAQLNAFNQTSISCRVFQDKTGKAHVAYSAVLSSSDTREEMRTHLGVWQGCLASFGAFLQDPNGYLAAAP